MMVTVSAALKQRLFLKERLAIGVIALLFSIAMAEVVDQHSSPSSISLSTERSSFVELAYIANGVNRVLVIDVLTSTVIKEIPVADGPYAVAIVPDGTRVYVTHRAYNGVSVIDTRTNTVIDFISVGYPQRIVITPDGSQAYVTSVPNNVVWVIDTATRMMIGEIRVGSRPDVIAITPDGIQAYVTNMGDPTVSVIYTRTRTVVATISIYAPWVAFTLDGAWACITSANDNSLVLIVNTQTRAISGHVTVGSTPYGITVAPNGTRMGVANIGSKTVSIIDTRIFAVIDTIQSNDLKAPYEVAFTSNETQIYVLNWNGSWSNCYISIIDLKTHIVIKTIEVLGIAGNIVIGWIPQ